MSRTDEDSPISMHHLYGETFAIHLTFSWINDSTFQTLERNQCVVIGAEVGYTVPIWHTAKKIYVWMNKLGILVGRKSMKYCW